MIVVAGAQRPTLWHVREPIFGSLRRSNCEEAPAEEVSGAAKALDGLDGLGLSQGTRALFPGGSAQRVYGV